MNPKVLLASLFLCVSGPEAMAQNSYGDMMNRDVAHYRLAIQKDPNNAQAQERLAYFLYCTNYKQVGNALHCDPALPAVQDEAIAHLEKAVVLQPNHSDWQQNLGMYLSNRGRYLEAVPHLKRSLHLLGPVKPFDVKRVSLPSVLQIGEGTFSSHYLLGDVLVKLGRYREAEGHYRQALLFDPDADLVLRGLGDALDRQGKRLQARAAWQKIVSHSPRQTFYSRQASLKLAEYPAP